MSDQEFPKRLEKKLPLGFTESIESMDSEEIKTKIYGCQCNIHEIEKAKGDDEKLAQAMEEVKNMVAPYKESQSAEAAKIKYCFFALEGRGVDISSVKNKVTKP